MLRPYNFVIFVSFVVKTVLFSLVAALPRCVRRGRESLVGDLTNEGSARLMSALS